MKKSTVPVVVKKQYLSSIDGSLHYCEVIPFQNGVHIRDFPSDNRMDGKNLWPVCLKLFTMDLWVLNKVLGSTGWHRLTLTEHHTASFQIFPSHCGLYPCNRQEKLIQKSNIFTSISKTIPKLLWHTISLWKTEKPNQGSVLMSFRMKVCVPLLGW